MNECERVEVEERNKDGPLPSLLFYESSVSLKKNLDRKKKKNFVKVVEKDTG